ncbi:MAG: Asp-tRNA(Asn)/Glu-tRNA(Gln) amidotransferase GatCAB subunit A [Candidatus Omnitrophota bacterium]|nr:MAG: Asp-tRNA(Asn)/Glu-tRNA(Gln) amidotransferase GatCAB subunit A [Candidatus Omnitrophota bacterium]HDN86069.1 Asp-tRNA(Asn)/Glu-tRNA(Gln) amidotransferase subunit GatA [Candidatus Omnitrophota bacterium]
MKKFFKLGGYQLAELIKDAKLDRNELPFLFQERAQRIDPLIKSFVEIYSQPIIGEGASFLKGIPIAIKDNICIKGKRITCASKILNSHISVYDATVIEKLKRAGLVILGTTNMDEFAFGSSCENSCYGPTKNPWQLERVSGGSSGGSAAAVAARLVPFALGSDTGGSIRQPASFCGVVGFKPTYGRVSRFGLVAFASSLDQIGPITTNFVDCAYLLNIICGFDKFDSTSAKVDVPDFTQALTFQVSDIKIGIPQEYFQEGLDKEVEEKIMGVAKQLEKKGAKLIDISLPHTEYAVATYYIIACSEASSNLQRYDGIKYGLRESKDNLVELYRESRGEGFGEEAKRRIFLGTYSLSSGYYQAYYLRALKVRTLIKNDFQKAFDKVDVILTPTSPTSAFKIGEKITDPLSMYLSDIYTISVNLAGLPAVSFPCGFDKNNLPVGVQLIGRAFDEQTLIRIGFSYQQMTDYHRQIPPLVYG